MENTSPLVIEKTLHASVARVWKALTEYDEMKHWYFDLPGFKPLPGYAFTFEGGTEENTYTHLCQITEVMPEKKLAYNWVYKGYEGHSLVTFELFPEGDHTRIRVTHTGLHTFPPRKDFARENFQAGWTEIIGRSLKEYVEKP